jgi:hypothetical protein
MIVNTAQSIPLYWQTAAGVPATGKVVGNLTIQDTLNGAAVSISYGLTEGSSYGAWREYFLTFTSPATTGELAIILQPNDGFLAYDLVQDEITNNSLDEIASLIAAPATSTLEVGGPSSDLLIRAVKNTFVPAVFTVRDANGDPVDVSGYTNPRFGVRDQAQSITYFQTTGISFVGGGTSGGIIVEIPENASFYSQLGAGVDAVTLYWDLVGDEGGTSSKTRCLARGQLSVVRTEQ